jgi:hypothetical protein
MFMVSNQMFTFRQQTNISMVLLVLPLFLFITGCTHSNSPSLAQQDEQRLRQYWQIPDHVALISLTSKPQTGGTFGREGLKLYAVFKFSPDELQRYRKTFRQADWQPLPIPANIFTLKDAPLELPRIDANGTYIYDASVKQQGAPQIAPGTETSDEISQFYIAFLNFDDFTLHAVYKAYY